MSDVNYPEFYAQHVDATVWFVCRNGHAFIRKLHHPRALAGMSRRGSFYKCIRCDRHKLTGKTFIHPDVTGALEAAERLGANPEFKDRNYKPLYKPNLVPAWRGAVAVHLLLWSTHERERVATATKLLRARIASG